MSTSTYPYSDASHPATAIRTASGLLVDLADFKPADVRMSDIAVSLAHQERYTGHCPLRPTVAQHSLAVEHIAIALSRSQPVGAGLFTYEALRVLSRAALMHDAAEAYVSDLSAPAKRRLREGRGSDRSTFDAMEAHVAAAIGERFDCYSAARVDIVHEADVLAWMFESAYAHWSPRAARELPGWLARDLYVHRCYPLGANDGGEAAFLRRAAALGMRDA